MKALRNTLFSLACVFSATVASAATVQIKFDNNIFQDSGYDALHIKFNLQSGTGTTTEYVAAGRFQGTASNVQGVPESIFFNGLNDVFMYCYDLYESINHGQHWAGVHDDEIVLRSQPDQQWRLPILLTR